MLNYINDISKSWQSDLESLLKENPKACVGEIGLDKAKPDYEKQKDVFIKQLELAKKYSDIESASFINGVLGSIIKEKNV